MQEVAWKKGDLALCSVKLGDVDPPPFLRKWRSLDVSKGSTDWQAIVASTRKLLKETQTKRFAPQDEKEADEATKRFEELHRVIEATRENDLKADAKYAQKRHHLGTGVLSLRRETSVFINCPYDPMYSEVFDAVVFATLCCGFGPEMCH